MTLRDDDWDALAGWWGGGRQHRGLYWRLHCRLFRLVDIARIWLIRGRGLSSRAARISWKRCAVYRTTAGHGGDEQQGSKAPQAPTAQPFRSLSPSR